MKVLSGHGKIETQNFMVMMRLRETPVPIPNTTVKTKTAEDTCLVTDWENKWSPFYIGV